MSSNLTQYTEQKIEDLFKTNNKKTTKPQRNYLATLSPTDQKTIKYRLRKSITTSTDSNGFITILANDIGSENPTSIIEHLSSLNNRLKEDVFPLLIHTCGKAPFTVLTNVLCYCDYVARLKFGDRQTKQNLEELFDDFGTYPYIKTRYQEYKNYLIQLYRHDLVHTLHPWEKIMLSSLNGNIEYRSIGWHIRSTLAESGAPKDKNELRENSKDKFYELRDLFKKESNHDGLVHLRVDKKGSQSPIINNYCFLFHLVNYIDNWTDEIKDSKQDEKYIKHLIDVILDSRIKLIRNYVPIIDLDNNKSI